MTNLDDQVVLASDWGKGCLEEDPEEEEAGEFPDEVWVPGLVIPKTAKAVVED